jgi:hypothetical protein
MAKRTCGRTSDKFFTQRHSLLAYRLAGVRQLLKLPQRHYAFVVQKSGENGFTHVDVGLDQKETLGELVCAAKFLQSRFELPQEE